MKLLTTLSLRLTTVFLLSTALALAQNPTPSKVEQLRDLIGQGRYAEAEATARELFATIEETHGAHSAEAAAVLDAWVESLWRGGKRLDPETWELAQSALETKEKIFGPEHVEIAESLNNLAVIEYFRGDYAEAEILWERALEIRQRELGPDDPQVARIMNSLGNLYQTTADFDEALRLYAGALRIREQTYGPDHGSVAQTLHNLANLLMNTGDYPRALELAERSLTIKEKTLGPDHPRLAQTLNLLGNILWETGDYDRAMAYDERALAIWIKELGPEHPDVAASLNNRAEQLRRIGEYEEARRLYERAQSIWEKKYGPDNYQIATSLRSLGQLLEEMGEYGAATAAYARAVAIREKSLGADHPFLALSLTDVGTLRAKLGDAEGARTALARAIEIQRGSLGSAHPYVADATGALATVVARTGDSNRALGLALDAETIARDHLRLTGRALSERHALQYAASQVGGLNLALTLSSPDLAPAARREVLDSLIRSRAVVLDEIAARSRSVSGTDDPEIARMAAELASARSHLANLTVRGLGRLEPDEYRVVFEAAREKKEGAERALAAANAEFARELGRGKLGLREAMASLPDKAALVSYVLYEREDLTPVNPGTEAVSTDGPKIPSPPVRWYAAFISRRGQDPVLVQLGPAEQIESRISRWKREAARGMIHTSRTPEEAETEYRAAGAQLRVKIWDPLLARLGGIERLFVVPDGELNLVSFAALPVAKTGYLIEKGPLLHYLSAERDLVPEAPAGRSGKGLIAVGGPNFDDASAPAGCQAMPETEEPVTRAGTRWQQPSCFDFESLEFKPLPAADREARQIVSIWKTSHPGREVDGKVLHLSGARAQESTFTHEAPGRRVLHLATHGFFLGRNTPAPASGSRGIGGLSVIEPAQVPDVACENPLLLSGLALAGANHRVETQSGENDGILTAEEIAGLDLSGVQWAVLSACDTGVGEIRAGEGVFGLRRAMQIAGVQTLIMSLWQVDDDATRTWMKALYEGRLQKKLDTAEAVQAASLAVLSSRRAAEKSTHPFFWAAFVAAGDWH